MTFAPPRRPAVQACIMLLDRRHVRAPFGKVWPDTTVATLRIYSRGFVARVTRGAERATSVSASGLHASPRRSVCTSTRARKPDGEGGLQARLGSNSIGAGQRICRITRDLRGSHTRVVISRSGRTSHGLHRDGRWHSSSENMGELRCGSRDSCASHHRPACRPPRFPDRACSGPPNRARALSCVDSGAFAFGRRRGQGILGRRRFVERNQQFRRGNNARIASHAAFRQSRNCNFPLISSSGIAAGAPCGF